MTQNEMILRHLKERGSITAIQALQDYGCMRLPSRIHELKKAGVLIYGKMESRKNRRGEIKTYKRYFLSEEKN